MGGHLKYLLILLIGVFAGGSMALFYANLDRAQGAYPRGVMAAMQHHYKALQSGLREPQCPPQRSLPSLQRLRTISDEVAPAFIQARQPGPDFEQRHAGLLTALDAAIAAPPADCVALNALTQDIGDRCDSCHAAFR